MEDDVAETALAAVIDGRHAGHFDYGAAIVPKHELPGLLGDQRLAGARDESHRPRLVEAGDLLNLEGASLLSGGGGLGVAVIVRGDALRGVAGGEQGGGRREEEWAHRETFRIRVWSRDLGIIARSEEHTSELQSLMRN